ncbi:aminoimidazole riboside kinase [Ammoniphilus sp. CFH 90114]|uniref:aminoimidazole riboside kinase n=1 Tax=Ammoniphilus sp. CFH 90114 TaxID=2493665 RepID=UPI00100E97DD|nr:aminoimidazole riboside kinase [Ammoniphilus sp. CFH 90114]RXT08049.1 aminoimidazole riboside kinase [Ammoniphilus sp. CFH 90114]
MSGVICLGEALIDFIPLDEHHLIYQKSPGGAPANVAVGISKLGGKAFFLGKLGQDVLGKFLLDTLEAQGVDVSYVSWEEHVRTGIVFVTLDPGGERSFSFYIDPSADRYLGIKDLQSEWFENNHILHFGSISLISEPSRSATVHAIQLAKQNGMLISYDPNLRLSLWKTPEEAKTTILSTIGQADILKISEEELVFLTGEQSIENGLSSLAQYDIPLIFITMGGEGCVFQFKGQTRRIPAISVSVVDTTGAGDAFVSGILYNINASRKTITTLTVDEVGEFTKFAAVSGGLAASTKGAMTALPTLPEVRKRLENEA